MSAALFQAIVFESQPTARSSTPEYPRVGIRTEQRQQEWQAENDADDINGDRFDHAGQRIWAHLAVMRQGVGSVEKQTWFEYDEFYYVFGPV